ncbi:MAG: ABC transporter ATP-binding protein [Proteobacteria bacterium]|nr:ABC transporter ATP-binding protein [Pseudomonadota bacterium]
MSLVAQSLCLRSDAEYHLNDVCFEMSKGEIYTIIGRTLAGKTTLLKTIAGLIGPDSGDLTLDGSDFGSIPVWKREVAMVYQQFINYPHLNVYENVAFPLKQRGMARSEIRTRAMKALSQVGLGGFENRKIQALSGGQQQRVALARSLVKEANIVLLDEPLVNLDYKLREQLREEFKNIFSAKASENSILIYSSTDPVEAMQLGGQILVMDEGRILQQASAKEVYENPSTTKVSQITNDPAMNLFEGTVAEGKIILSSQIQLDLPQHCRTLAYGNYTFGLRAAAITLDASGFPFTVELSEISGSETFLHLKHEHIHVVGLLDSVQNFNTGETVTAKFDTTHLYAFANDGRLKSSPYGGVQ